jgi:hypothetical protein
MSAPAGTAAVPREEAHAGLADRLVQWLQTGDRRDDLFTADVFLDFSLPQWRIQAQGAHAAFGIREAGHPYPGQVRVEALDRTSRGFLIQFEERWTVEAQRWYCRELIHCIVLNGLISELSVYCTGDWDQAVQQAHAEQVTLLRP